MASDQPQLHQAPSTCVKFDAGLAQRPGPEARTFAQGGYHRAILRRRETARQMNRSGAFQRRRRSTPLLARVFRAGFPRGTGGSVIRRSTAASRGPAALSVNDPRL
jgi:hypothetical protein